ncbi:MAG: hypothetical protein ACRCUY_07860 [Thermoguttaceae bacterium]
MSLFRLLSVICCLLASFLFLFCGEITQRAIGQNSEQNVSDHKSVGGESAKPNFVPGSLITISSNLNTKEGEPMMIDYESVANRADLVEVLAQLPPVDPALADDVRFNPEMWAKEIRYTRDVWCLDFHFKPIRIIEVDIPNKQGTLDKKKVWYLVYSVKNPGPLELTKLSGGKITEYELKKQTGILSENLSEQKEIPIAKDVNTTIQRLPGDSEKRVNIKQTHDTPLVLRNTQGLAEPAAGQEADIVFEPQFLLATDSLLAEQDDKTGEVKRTSEVYHDQIIPLAIPAIMKREGMKGIPANSVSISSTPLKTDEERWGVAMWTDIDPRINKFSLYISGLTNAYKWQDSGKNDGTPGDGRTMQRKVLKTNWWRIGDSYNLHDAQIQYGQPGGVDFEWIFL